MPVIESIERVSRLFDKKREMSRRQDNASVIVGYTAKYALFVHERVEMKLKGLPRSGMRATGSGKGVRKSGTGRGFFWDPQGRGQAKFLEQPARTMARELGDIVRRAVAGGASMSQGLLMAGLRLQRESMLLVPVDTGNLKASAFTRKE